MAVPPHQCADANGTCESGRQPAAMPGHWVRSLRMADPTVCPPQAGAKPGGRWNADIPSFSPPGQQRTSLRDYSLDEGLERRSPPSRISHSSACTKWYSWQVTQRARPAGS